MKSHAMLWILIIRLCFISYKKFKQRKIRSTRSHGHNGLFWQVSLRALQFSEKNNLDFLLEKTRSHFHMCPKQNWTIQYPRCANVDIMKKMTKSLAAMTSFYCYQLYSGMKALFIPAVNKVPGYWIQNKPDFANKPRNIQIFPHSKFGINRSTGLKVMTKKFVCVRNNFLAITFKPVDRSVPNFECGKICMFLGLFAKSVLPWNQ